MSTKTIPLGHTFTLSARGSDCTTAVPDKYGHVPFGSCNSNYTGNPSFEGNLAFAVLFGLSMLGHFAQGILYKKKYCWVVIMASIWETAAFSIRTAGAHDQQQKAYAIVGQLLFLLAPLWINAFAYMTVARMIYFALPEQKLWKVKATKLTVIFVWLDVICFLVQGLGGSLLGDNGNEKLTKLGTKIYVAGIALQLVFVVVFCVLTGWFYRLFAQISYGNMGRMKYLTWCMLAVMALIVMRIVFRLAEFTPGVNADNKMLTNESYPLGLDAFPMLLALILINVMHPGLVLRGPESEFPKISRKEKKAAKKQKKAEKKQRKADKKAGKQKKKNGEYMLTENMHGAGGVGDSDSSEGSRNGFNYGYNPHGDRAV